MADLSTPGLGSGLDVKGIVDKLMSIERAPINALNKKEATLLAKISSLGGIKSGAASLQTAAINMSSASKLFKMAVTSSDSTTASATAGETAVAGKYSLETIQLAQAATLAAPGVADATTEVGKGTLTIDIGTWSGGVFSGNPAVVSKSIVIDDSNKTLSGIRDAINASGAPVRASIVTDETGARLVLNGKETGAKNDIRITVADSDGNNTDGYDATLNPTPGLSMLAYNPPTQTVGQKYFGQEAAAQNAQFKLDGLQIEKASNTVTDVIEGVTINLLKKASTSVLSVSQDSSAIKTSVEAFVKAFTDLSKSLKDSGFDVLTQKRGALAGDSLVASIQGAIRNGMSSPAMPADAPFKFLGDIGVAFQRDGTFKLDTAKLAKAIETNAQGVANLVAAVGTAMDKALDPLLASSGTLKTKVDSINSSIKLIGKQRIALELRMATVEKRYTSQFVALDGLIAGMTQTSSFLSQQLSSLPGSNSNSNN